jgi:hypothetical protein
MLLITRLGISFFLQLLSWGLSHKLRGKKKKTHKNLPKNQLLSLLGFFQAPLMEEGRGRGVFGNGNSQNNPSIYRPCPPLTPQTGSCMRARETNRERNFN